MVLFPFKLNRSMVIIPSSLMYIQLIDGFLRIFLFKGNLSFIHIAICYRNLSHDILVHIIQIIKLW